MTAPVFLFPRHGRRTTSPAPAPASAPASASVPARPYPPRRRAASGFSLIELMISMVIGLFITGMVITLFLSSNKSATYQEATARMQENARFAMDAMSRSLRSSGYRSCGNADEIRVLNVVNGGATNWWINLEAPLLGYEGGASSFPSQAVNRIATTDAVSAVGVNSAAEISIVSHDISTGVMATGAHNLKAGRLLVASDCSYSTLFQMSGPAGSGLTSVIHAAGGTPGNCYLGLGESCDKSEENHAFSTGAILTPLASSLYYIAPAASGSGRSMWIVTLNDLGRMDADSNKEFIEGVDDMQLEYGEDTDADGAPNGYVTANNVGTWNNVVSVRINLLMSTLADGQSTAFQTYEFNGATVTATDRRVRRSFSSVVNLRNRAF